MKKTRPETASKRFPAWEIEVDALALRLRVSAKKMKRAFEQLLIQHAAQSLFDNQSQAVLAQTVTAVRSQKPKGTVKPTPNHEDQPVARHIKHKEAEFPGA